MGGKTQKVTNETKVPAYVEAAYKDLIAKASPIAETPYDPATNRSVAGFTAPQQQAFGNVQNIQGIQNPYLSQAQQYAQSGASTISPENISQYLNPYQSQVIDATMSQIGRNNAMQQSQVTGNAALQGALGGDRVGVAQAELARNQDMNTQNILAQLNSQNYNQALSAAQADKSRQFQGSSAYSALGNQAQQAGYQDISALLGIGGQQQGLEQLGLDTASANAQQQYQQPFNNLSWLAGITQGVGSSAGGTSTQTTPGPSPWSQVAGLGIAALGAFSDERVKEDEEVIGTTFDGQPIHKYRKFGSPQFEIGLMAQEVEKRHPEAVGQRGGIKTVNYDVATKDAAAQAPSHMDDLLSRVHSATQGISAIKKAAGGRTEEPKGIGAPQGFAGGGLRCSLFGGGEDPFSRVAVMSDPSDFSGSGGMDGAGIASIPNAMSSGRIAQDADSGSSFLKNMNSPLVAMGLGMAGSQSPNVLGSAAEGALAGLNQYQMRKRRDKRGFAEGGLPWDDEEPATDDTFAFDDITMADPYGDEVVSTAAVAPAPSGWQGLGVPRERLPAGMRNNNPGNIKYFKGLNYPGLVGPSENTDQGDPQMLFDNPQSGMNAAAKLAYRKYAGGKRSARDLIAGNMGWTPGNIGAAENIARTMGVGLDDDLGLSDPTRMQGFLKALTLQEHGPSSKLYGDDLYASASKYIDGGAMPQGEAANRQAMVANAAESARTPSGIGTAAAAPPESSGGLGSIFGKDWEPNIPLLAAGLSMLASKNPNALAAIGEGGLTGVQALMKQRQAQSGAKKLAEAAQLAQQRLGIQQESLAERRRHNMEVEKLRASAANKGPSFSKNVIYAEGPDGEVALLQPGDQGEAVATKLPPNYKVRKDPIRLDLGDRFAILDPVTRQKIGEEMKNVAEEERQKKIGAGKGEREIAKPEATLTARTALSGLDRLDAEVDNLKGMSGLPSATGNLQARSWMPNIWQSTADADSSIRNLKGKVATSALQAMRDASKTGGAVGGVTEKEWPIIESMIANLDPLQGDDVFIQRLNELKDYVKGAKERLAAAYRETYGEDPAAAAPSAPPSGNTGGFKVLKVE